MKNEELIKNIRAGDENALSALIKQNMPFARICAGWYTLAAEKNGGCSVEDLEQAAAVGLLLAVPVWDEERGAFLTIAEKYMRNECRKLLGFYTTKKRIENEQGTVSLSSPVDEEGTELVELIPDRHAGDPFEAAAVQDMQRIVRAEVAKLPDKQRKCLSERFFDGKALKDIDASQDTMQSAIMRLRRSARLKELYAEYVSAFFFRKGVKAFASTQTSAVEAAVMFREERYKGIAAALVPHPPQGCAQG